MVDGKQKRLRWSLVFFLPSFRGLERKCSGTCRSTIKQFCTFSVHQKCSVVVDIIVRACVLAVLNTGTGI